MAALLARLPLSHGADATDDAALLDHHAFPSTDPPDACADRQDPLRPLMSAAPLSRPGSSSGDMVFGRHTPYGLSLPSPIATPRQHTRYRSISVDVVAAETVTSRDSASPPATSGSRENTSPTAPDSPPDLCDEKSSKSSRSSLRSESELSMSDATASSDKLSSYNQLAIDDFGRDSLDDSNLRPESRPTLRRVTPRAKPVHANAHPEPRDGPAAVHPLAPLRRTHTTPAAAPQLWPTNRSQPSSRSPSPRKPYARSDAAASPIMRSASATSLSSEERSPSSQAAFPARPPWHPRRKSVRELEAECNDEEEDEVPADAILENVPISPMPGAARSSRLSSRSATPSPNRRGSWQAHANLHSANVPKNAKRPSGPPVLPNGQRGSPRTSRNGRPPMPTHSATVGAFPPSQRGKPRSKSWTEDLNEEARQLSAALEEYADRDSLGPGSGRNSASGSPPRPALLEKKRAMTEIRELKGSVIIDPLPVSKEKEAVLTRTRPSWLPPKSQKEERRHLREWEQMMARAAENDRKRALREREARESREELSGSVARIWDQHVLPNWDQVIREPRTRELWWRGVTPRCRGEVWSKAIGNELELSEASFAAALGRADALEERLASLPEHERASSRAAAWFDAIRRDVPTVFHQQQVSSPDADPNRPPFHAALADVLRAYAMYRSDVGYVYGTHDIAGLLCLHMPPADAFVALANALNRPLPLAFLMHDAAGMTRAYNMVLGTLKYKLPRLHGHLTSPTLDLAPAEFLDPLFRRLFAGPPVHPDLAARIWDVFVFEGDKALVRAAVAILSRLEHRLYAGRDEVLDLLSWSNLEPVKLGDEDDFIAAVREAGKVDGSGRIQSGE